MIDATVESVFEAVRGELGDRRIPGGDVYTNGFLYHFFARAYEEMTNALAGVGAPFVRRVVHKIIPPRVTRVAGVAADIAFPELVYVRPISRKASIIGTTAGSSVMVTVSSHTFTADLPVVVVDCGAEIDGAWFVVILGPTQFVLLGASATTAYSGGWAVQSDAEYVRLSQVDHQHLSTNSRSYVWSEGVITLPASDDEQEMKVVYASDGSVPMGGKLGIPGAFNFLVARTAQLAAQAKDMPTRAAELAMQAEAAKAELVRIQVRGMQAAVYQPPPYGKGRMKF